MGVIVVAVVVVFCKHLGAAAAFESICGHLGAPAAFNSSVVVIRTTPSFCSYQRGAATQNFVIVAAAVLTSSSSRAACHLTTSPASPTIPLVPSTNPCASAQHRLRSGCLKTARTLSRHLQMVRQLSAVYDGRDRSQSSKWAPVRCSEISSSGCGEREPPAMRLC